MPVEPVEQVPQLLTAAAVGGTIDDEGMIHTDTDGGLICSDAFVPRVGGWDGDGDGDGPLVSDGRWMGRRKCTLTRLLPGQVDTYRIVQQYNYR